MSTLSLRLSHFGGGGLGKTGLPLGTISEYLLGLILNLLLHLFGLLLSLNVFFVPIVVLGYKRRPFDILVNFRLKGLQLFFFLLPF